MTIRPTLVLLATMVLCVGGAAAQQPTLVVENGDPLTDPAALRSVEVVVKGGRIMVGHAHVQRSLGFQPGL